MKRSGRSPHRADLPGAAWRQHCFCCSVNCSCFPFSARLHHPALRAPALTQQEGALTYGSGREHVRLGGGAARRAGSCGTGKGVRGDRRRTPAECSRVRRHLRPVPGLPGSVIWDVTRRHARPEGCQVSQPLNCVGRLLLPPASAWEGQGGLWHAAKSTCLQLPLWLRAPIVHK